MIGVPRTARGSLFAGAPRIGGAPGMAGLLRIAGALRMAVAAAGQP